MPDHERASGTKRWTRRIWCGILTGFCVILCWIAGSSIPWIALPASSQAQSDALDVVFATIDRLHRVCFGDGRGGFACQPVAEDQEDAKAVALGDLDGDRSLDAIFVGDDLARVCLASAREGLVCHFIDHDLSEATGVALGDFDGDGSLDAAISRNEATDAVCYGLGDGGVTCRPLAPDVLNSSGVVVDDFDGDSLADVVVARGWYDGRVSVICLGARDRSLACRDLDELGELRSGWDNVVTGRLGADPHPDLVFPNVGGQFVQCLSLGNGRFDCSLLEGPSAASKTAIGDLDADGHADLVLTGHRTYACFGDGARPPRFACEERFGVVGGLAVAIADLNGDRIADVMLAGPERACLGIGLRQFVCRAPLGEDGDHAWGLAVGSLSSIWTQAPAPPAPRPNWTHTPMPTPLPSDTPTPTATQPPTITPGPSPTPTPTATATGQPAPPDQGRIEPRASWSFAGQYFRRMQVSGSLIIAAGGDCRNADGTGLKCYGSLVVVDSKRSGSEAVLGTYRLPEKDLRPIDLAVSGTLALLVLEQRAANGVSGYRLRFLDLSRPTAIIQLGELSLPPDDEHADLVAARGHLFWSRRGGGIEISRIDPRGRLSFVASITGDADGLAVDGDRLFTATRDPDLGLRVFDIHDPSSPTIVGQMSGRFSAVTAAAGRAVLVQFGALLCLGSDPRYPHDPCGEGLVSLDVSDLGRIRTIGSGRAVYGSHGPVLLRADGWLTRAAGPLQVIDARHPALPVIAEWASGDLAGFVEDLAFVGTGRVAVLAGSLNDKTASIHLIELRHAAFLPTGLRRDATE